MNRLSPLMTNLFTSRLSYFLITILMVLVSPLALPVFAQGPATETTIITATNGAPYDHFGWRLDIDHGRAVISAPSVYTNSGEVYMYERNQGGVEMWGEAITLTNNIPDGYFGFGISLDDDTLAIGAPNLSPNGAVYIYERNAGGIADSWGEVISLTIAGDILGHSVALSGDTLVTNVETQNKAYVFERNEGGINNWGQVATLTVSSAIITNSEFAISLAIDGDTIVVGDPSADVNGNTDQGAAYIFTRNEGGANNWGLTATLTETLGHANDEFGEAVTIDHDRVVIGAPGTSAPSLYKGQAFLFERNAGGTADDWVQSKRWVGENGSDYFGSSVAIDNDTVVVGAEGAGVGGASYVYRRNRGGVADSWGIDVKLEASDTAVGDNFGNAIALDVDSNTFLIGAVAFDSYRGKAYIFNSTGNFWTQTAAPVAQDGAQADYFGNAISISGSTLLVGAEKAEINASSHEMGEAYIFERNEGGRDNWGQVITLTRSGYSYDEYFGSAVALDNDTAIVGAQDARVGSHLSQGAAVIFERNEGGADNWGQIAELTASDGQNNDDFGGAVAISGDTALVGAPLADPNGSSAQGIVYIFERNEDGMDNWGQVISITTGASVDYFGESVAISGDTAIIGAQHADPNGNTEQGAAYIYERNQGGANNWGQVITLTEGVSGDHFGISVAIDGDIAVVSASDAKPDGSTDTGAVYVFERNEGGVNNWGLVTRLAPSILEEDDWGNAKVSVSGDTILVGAYLAGDSGKAYVFDRNEGGADNWGLSGVWESTDDSAIRFGFSAALDANTIAIGDTYADVDGKNSQGSAYVYQLALAPDLGISKNVTPTTVNPGDTITYTLSYSNHGIIPAFGVVITDNVPISVTNLSYSNNGAIITPTGTVSYVWNVADLPVNADGIITITGILSDNLPTQIFANTAEINATNEGWLNDNSASAEVTVGDIAVRGLTTQNNSPALTGAQVSFTATITNGYEVNYVWNFGNGDTGTGATASSDYQTNGIYTAIVTATSPINLMTATTIVTITDEAIDGLALTGDSPVDLGADPHLLATVTAGSSVQYDWDFGNGEFCRYGNCDGQPMHGIEYEYIAVGTYTVVVTAYNALNTLTDTITIEVTPVYDQYIYLPLVLK